MSEYWDVYDKFRNRTNKIIQRDSSELLKNGEYHIVVTGIVENSNKQILITRRNKNKKLYTIIPNLWFVIVLLRVYNIGVGRTRTYKVIKVKRRKGILWEMTEH